METNISQHDIQLRASDVLTHKHFTLRIHIVQENNVFSLSCEESPACHQTYLSSKQGVIRQLISL